MNGEGLEGIFFQVDQVDVLLRVAPDVARIGGRAQEGMAERHETRKIVAHPVYRAGAHAPDQAHETVFTANIGRPTVQIAAECHPSRLGEKVTPVAFAFHHLDQDGHTLVIILETFAPAVEQRPGVHRGNVDLDDGAGQVAQVLRGAALVGAKDAVVFTRERGPKVILQQAGGAHDQGAVAHRLEQPAQVFEDLGRELPGLVIALDDGVIGAHIIFRLVFLVHPVHQVVQGHKGVEDI